MRAVASNIKARCSEILSTANWTRSRFHSCATRHYILATFIMGQAVKFAVHFWRAAPFGQKQNYYGL